ncbi:peptidoglycan-binding domain-containing protein [Nocardioides sp.]|uniref:peptidoglycan-binding domain-containing protein n=1 Tax=Nocardioides sp. TaxID=35761 RepID=UPI00286AFA4B|nr:peptidoglycan-binding domain-containing protein [Nocardioides sp.]
MGRRRALWLPLAAALLGATAGVATALVVPDEEPVTSESSFNDPLRVGVPLVDLECTGDAVIVLGYGETGAPLRSAVVNNPDETVRYLRTDDSCPTLWGPPENDVPEYVAYSGPYDSLMDPCLARLTGEHKRDDVTRLHSGNTTYVKCVCEVPTADLRVLSRSDGTDPETAIWVRSLQNTLIDIDVAAGREDRFRPENVTGIFDEATEQRVKDFQEVRDIVPPTGVVDAETWGALTDQVCITYDY